MSIVDRQREFYRALFERHGDDPRSLSWRDDRTQRERHERIARCFERESGEFSVHEVGCGLGDFGAYLGERHPAARYSGSDIVEPFVEACRKRFPASRFELRDVSAGAGEERYDFVVQSGMFNPRLDTPVEEWREFVFHTLEAMYRMARKALVTDFLTTYSDAERRRDDLFYLDPRELIDEVHRRFSRHVTIDASGPLYEYTAVVYRPEQVRALHPGTEFDRYFDPAG